MNKRRMTPIYIFFYILFSPDTWRIVIGLIAAALITPRVALPDQPFAPVVLFFMLAAIGYAVSAVPGRKIAVMFRDRVLKNRGA